MYGYWGKVLRINLTSKTYESESVSESTWKKFVGGSGFGAKVLLEETPPKVDPLSRENKIIFGGGCWQAVKAPGNAKWSVETKSPLTKTFLDSAGSGSWGYLFKQTGYDALIIEGKSSSPVYLYITNSDVEFKNASHLWGKDTRVTTDLIKDELGNKRVSMLNIGPSGEICNPIACISCDAHSFAGRGGAGAVLGSKNLKAIVVFGDKQVPVYDEDTAKKKSSVMMKLLAKSTSKWRKHGTTISPFLKEPIGDIPMKYWTQDTWKEVTQIAAPRYTQVLQAKPFFCVNCPIGCHRRIKVESPKKYAMEGSGPEYETLCSLGTSFLNSNLKSIAKGNDVCNRMGIDTISAGFWISFLAECWEKGLIDEKDTEGLKIEWGDGDIMLELLEKIGKLEGIGAWFKDGIRGAAEHIGPQAKDMIVHVKNMDYPAHDPRFAVNLGVNYATGTRGACHNRGFALIITSAGRGITYPELGLDNPENTMENAAKIAYITQNVSSFFGQVSLCQFQVVVGDMTLTQVCEIFNAITGWDWTVQDMFDAGRRAFTIQRLINARDGITRKDDTLPKKITIPAKEGGRIGRVPLPHNKTLDEYYKMRAWDKNGLPTEESLARLGLEEYIPYLIE